MFNTGNITIAHKRYCIAINADDAVNYITTLFDPRQHYVTHLQLSRLDKVYTLLAANDEGQHAITLDRKGDTHAFIDKADGITDDVVIGYIRH
jgi:hypothetical protein